MKNKEKEYKVFPWWGGYLLGSGLRKIYQNPEKILKPYVKSGMQVADIGCGMGYFTLPMTNMVGSQGKVIAVDLQKEMLRELERRAKKLGNLTRLQLQCCSQHSIEIKKWRENLDFILVFAIAHEVPNREGFFKEIAEAMKPGAQLLLVEPRWHVNQECFEESIAFAKACGLKVIGEPKINISRTVLMEK